MEDGYFLGAVFGICFCILIVVIAVFASKKEKKKIEKIKSQVSKENMEVLSNSKYYNYEPNNNFIIGTSYIYDIVEEEKRVKIMLLYPVIPRNKNDIDYNIDSVYMSKEECENKKLKVGMCVKTLHNTAIEVRFKIKEILND